MRASYTVVYKDYEGESFIEAMGKALQDEITITMTVPDPRGRWEGWQDKGYKLDHWEWDESVNKLRVWYQ